MKLRKTVQVVDPSHPRLNQWGVVMSQEGDKCVVRFASSAGVYRKVQNKINQFHEYPEEELLESQLKQEEA